MNKKLLFLFFCLMLCACASDHKPHHNDRYSYNDRHSVGYIQPAPKQTRHDVAPKHQEEFSVNNRKERPEEYKNFDNKRDRNPSKKNEYQPNLREDRPHSNSMENKPDR